MYKIIIYKYIDKLNICVYMYLFLCNIIYINNINKKIYTYV